MSDTPLLPDLDAWIRLRCAAFAVQRFADPLPTDPTPLSDAWFSTRRPWDRDLRPMLERIGQSPDLDEVIDVMVELRDAAFQADGDALPLLDGQAEIARERELLDAPRTMIS